MKKSFAAFIFLFAGCTIRLHSDFTIETEEAVYSDSTSSHASKQKYDPHQYHLTFFENLMSAITPTNLAALADIINGGIPNVPTPTPSPVPSPHL